MEAESVHAPGVGVVRLVVELHEIAADVLQLDELIARPVRVIVDLRDDDGADARADVADSEGIAQRDGEMFLAGAGDVAADGGPIVGGAEVETVRVAGEVGVRIRAEEIDAAAQRIEREAREQAGRGIELPFVEQQVAASVDDRAGRNKELARRSRRVAQEPAANVHASAGGVEQLDEVGTRIGA